MLLLLLTTRYYICDDKLAALGKAPGPRACFSSNLLSRIAKSLLIAGWKETVQWEEGLKWTIDWYMQHNVEEYWDKADIERALQPHPVMHAQTARFNS